MLESIHNSEAVEELLTRIRDGLVEAIQKEVDRRRRLGVPLYVEQNGGVAAIVLDSDVSTNANP